MKARHTPGPLEVVGSTIRDSSGRKLAQTLPGGAFAMTPEQEANAALFAAAPALAEALAKLSAAVQAIREGKRGGEVFGMLSAADDDAREALALAGLAD